MTPTRLLVGVGLSLAAQWLRKWAEDLERMARDATAPPELAQAHRDKADVFRQAAKSVLAQAHRRGFLRNRRGMPRTLDAPCGPFQKLRKLGVLDTRLFGPEQRQDERLQPRWPEPVQDRQDQHDR